MSIVDVVQDYLTVSRVREAKSSDKRKFYVSDMGKCYRMRWLKRKGITSEFPPHVHWIFQIGNLYHDYVYKALESQGILLKSEEYVETDHFRGRYDGIVKDDEGKAVLDIKSAGGYKIDRVRKGEDDEQYISQILTYQMLLQDEGEKLKKSIILYVNKEPSDNRNVSFIEKNYRLTKWREKILRKEMREIIDHWEKDEIPYCLCPAWMKNYNAFQPLCEMEEKKIRKILKDIEKGKKYVTTKKVLYLVDGDERKEVAKIK